MRFQPVPRDAANVLKLLAKPRRGLYPRIDMQLLSWLCPVWAFSAPDSWSCAGSADLNFSFLSWIVLLARCLQSRNIPLKLVEKLSRFFRKLLSKGHTIRTECRPNIRNWL